MKLLPLLQQAFPSATGYENLVTVVQANAEGHLVKILYDDEISIDVDDDKEKIIEVEVGPPTSANILPPPTAFIKYVDANYYSEQKKSWNNLRRTLMYCRTEARFYQEFASVISNNNLQILGTTMNTGITPQIYHARYDLEGLVTEKEGATDSTDGPVNVDWMTTATAVTAASAPLDTMDESPARQDDTKTSHTMKGAFLIMEGISQEEYLQDSPITIDQAMETLHAVASLHAAAWEDHDLLCRAQQRLSRGSYHLRTRNPKELEGMGDAWDHFMDNFRSSDTNGILNKCGVDFGRRIQRLAEYVSNQVSPEPTDPFATLCHGDYKAMNCFLPRKANGDANYDGGSTNNNNYTHNRRPGVVMVDFASTGVGLGMSDVAMHIHHAVRPGDLAYGGEMLLVDHYLTVLNDLLQQQQRRRSQPLSYSREVALKHYRLAVADYFRFFLGRFWKSATPESFAKKKDSKNTALINRDLDAAFAFLERVESHVTQIEQEAAQEELLVKTGIDDATERGG